MEAEKEVQHLMEAEKEVQHIMEAETEVQHLVQAEMEVQYLETEVYLIDDLQCIEEKTHLHWN